MRVRLIARRSDNPTMPNSISSRRAVETPVASEAPEVKPAAPLAVAKPEAPADKVESADRPKPLAEAPRANVASGGAGTLRMNIEAQLENGRIGNKAEVAALLLAYFPNKAETVSRAAERMLTPVAFLDTELRKAKTKDEAIAIAGSSDFRRRVFTLEGSLKMYRGRLSDELDAQYDNVKKLEDSAGGYSYAQTMTKVAKDNKAPAQVIALLEKKEAAAKKALGDTLDELGLTLDEKNRFPAFKSLVRDVRHADFGSYDQDRKGLLKIFKHTMKEIEESDYDMNDLENGLHELRRQLRWVTIYTEAVDGLVQHDVNVAPKIPEALADPVASSKYMTMPPADREMKPVVVSTSLYAKNQKVVLDLGALKDRGEAIHGMRDAFLATGLAKNEVEATDAAIKLLNLKPEEADLGGLAKPIYAAIQQDGWFKQLRKQLSGD